MILGGVCTKTKHQASHAWHESTQRNLQLYHPLLTAAAATDRNSELEAENKRLVDEVAALVEGSAADKRQLEGKVTAVEAEKAAVEAEKALVDDRITVVEAERDAGRQQLEAKVAELQIQLAARE